MMSDNSVDVGDNDALLIIRDRPDDEAKLAIECGFKMDENMCATKLLALALSWSCQNEEWRHNMIMRAKHKVMKILEDEGYEYK
jgi:hypothetical protein